MESTQYTTVFFQYVEQIANDPTKGRSHKYIIDLISEQAVSEFFTDLSILVRRTPAPCPICGTQDIKIFKTENWFVSCIKCGQTGANHAVKDSAVNYWNRIAVPAAYRRMTTQSIEITDQSDPLTPSES